LKKKQNFENVEKNDVENKIKFGKNMKLKKKRIKGQATNVARPFFLFLSPVQFFAQNLSPVQFIACPFIRGGVCKM